LTIFILVFLILSLQPSQWQPEEKPFITVGKRIQLEDIKSQAKPPIDSTLALVCGSPDFAETMKRHLLDLGIKENLLYVFH